MKNSLPRILYKYRSFQESENLDEVKKYQKKSLIENEVFFSHPDLFNDPFDLNIGKVYDKYFDELLTLTSFHLYKSQNDRHLSVENLIREADNRIKRNIESDSEYYKNASKKELNEFKKRHSVFCLSEKNDDILMWAHYGNSNKGFCIGYDTHKLIETAKENVNLQCVLKVEYSNVYPEIIPSVSKERNIEMLTKRLCTKSNVWEYEKEWRLISLLEPNNTLKLTPTCISEIILGSNIDPNVKKEIIDIRNEKYSHAKLLVAKPDDYHFKLNIEEINL